MSIDSSSACSIYATPSSPPRLTVNTYESLRLELEVRISRRGRPWDLIVSTASSAGANVASGQTLTAEAWNFEWRRARGGLEKKNSVNFHAASTLLSPYGFTGKARCAPDSVRDPQKSFAHDTPVWGTVIYIPRRNQKVQRFARSTGFRGKHTRDVPCPPARLRRASRPSAAPSPAIASARPAGPVRFLPLPARVFLREEKPPVGRPSAGTALSVQSCCVHGGHECGHVSHGGGMRQPWYQLLHSVVKPGTNGRQVSLLGKNEFVSLMFYHYCYCCYNIVFLCSVIVIVSSAFSKIVRAREVFLLEKKKKQKNPVFYILTANRRQILRSGTPK